MSYPTLLAIAVAQAGALFLALAGVAQLILQWSKNPHLAIIAGWAILGTAAMLFFWASFALLEFGTSIKIASAFGCVSIGAASLYGVGKYGVDREIGLICGFGALVSVILVGWTYSNWNSSDPLLLHAGERWIHPLPGDNRIPLDFALAMKFGHIPSPLHGDWLSSDRPPLQTAFYLVSIGRQFLIGEITYQTAAVALQMTALVMCFVCLRLLNMTSSLALLGMIALFFTPFVIVNGAYVWPKMLAASYGVALFAIFFTPAFETVKASAIWGSLGGALAALAMLSHGAAVFSLLGVAGSAVILRRMPSWKFTVAGIITAIAIYAPWMAYQKFFDPPGDRLIKWMLAGVTPIDSRSALQAIADSYSSVSVTDLVEHKIEDVKIIVAGVADNYRRTLDAFSQILSGETASARQTLVSVRDQQFFGLVIGGGLLGFGILLLPLLLFDGALAPAAAAVLLGLASWAMILFGPAQTIIHQGSYAVFLSMMVAVLAWLSRWRVAFMAVCAAQIVFTAFQYVL